MNVALAYSRPQKTADSLGDLAEDRHRFLNKQVLLTGEREVLLARNGAACFLDSLRLLVRICRNIVVAVPAKCAKLQDLAESVAKRISFQNTITFTQEAVDMAKYDAILSVGSEVHPELPWTTINSNGWIVRVSSGSKALSAQCDQANPIGALAAASLGAGEVFKRLIRLREDRGELFNGFSYSLRTYRSYESDFGPALPENLPADLLIVGAGAIGNGLVHLASQLNLTGKIRVIDSQEFATENLGTCILVGPDAVGRSKAILLTDYLKEASKDAYGFHMPFDQYTLKLDGQPAIVLNGLDNIDVRHEVQRSLWPDVVIDGAIGDFTCQVSRHPWPADIACLICLFRKLAGRPAEEVQREATGLSDERLKNPDAVVRESDINDAPPEKKAFLRSRVGRPICSVVQEAIAQAISTEQQTEGFQPSVPFVACFSACMVMSEVMANMCNWPSILEPRFQFDFLRGPAYGQELPQARRKDCICMRRKNIDQLRAARITRLGRWLQKIDNCNLPQQSPARKSDMARDDNFEQPTI